MAHKPSIPAQGPGQRFQIVGQQKMLMVDTEQRYFLTGCRAGKGRLKVSDCQGNLVSLQISHQAIDKWTEGTGLVLQASPNGSGNIETATAVLEDNPRDF